MRTAKQQKIKLTKKDIQAAVKGHVKGERTRIWIEGGNGLHISITPAGVATYCLRYRRPSGGAGDYGLGRVDLITHDQAKLIAAQKLVGLLHNGVDPAAERRQVRHAAKTSKQQTFDGLVEAYLTAPENRHLSDRTVAMRTWLNEKYVEPTLGNKPIAEITRRDVKDCIRQVQEQAAGRKSEVGNKGNRTANMVHGFVRCVFNWAINDDRVDVNPAAFDKLFNDTPKKRIGMLDEGRVRVIWRALEEEKAKDWGKATATGIQLCALTLQRPNEIVSARREDFDRKEMLWRISEDRTKTNTLYEVPVTDCSLGLFDEAAKLSNSQWLFPAENGKDHLSPNALSHRFDKMRRRLVKAGALPRDVHLYDFRRWGRTYLTQSLLIPEHIAERVINHAPDMSMARRYDVGDYSKEIRSAHEEFGAAFRRIIANEATNDDSVGKIAAE